MRNLLKSIVCFATVALVGTGALADNYDGYGWYDGAMAIGGVTTDCTEWSRDADNPTGLGDLTDMTISSVAFNIWDNANNRGGANMGFRVYRYENGQRVEVGVLSHDDFWLGAASFITGSTHDYAIAWTGEKDLAAAVGLTLEHGQVYHIEMWIKTYRAGDYGWEDRWYNGDNEGNYHAEFTYRTPQTVTFDWNGAPLDPIGPFEYPIGGEYDGEGFVGDAPLWAGHVFLGWWTDRVNGDRIRQGVEVSDQDSLEVFAHWGDEHVVRFNPNGGVCDKVSRICVQGATYYGLPKPTRTGYAFLGWCDDDDGGTLVQNGVTQVPYTSGRTLVAHWSGRQTVTFDANEGQCDVQSKTCIVGGKYYLPKATRDGYAFLGWFLGDTQYKSGVTVVTEDNEITLVARWQGRQTVIFDANDGQCDVQSKTCIKGGKYYLPKATRDGYAFLGWFLGDTQFKSGVTVVTEDNEITLVAHWKERTAPLAFSGFSFASKAARATPRAGTATLPVNEEYTGTQSWTALTGFSGNGVGTYADGRCKFDSNSDWLMVQFDSAPGTLTFDVKGNSSSSGTAPGSFLVEESADGSDWDEVANLPSSSFNASDYTTFAYTLDSASRYVRWTYAQKYNFNLGLNNVHITAGSASEPTVTVQATATEIEEGESVTVTASASGFSDNDNVKWAWFLGETQQAETSATLSLNNLAEGTYQVTAWGYLGDALATATEKDDDTVTITVNPASVWYTITVDDQIANGTIEADKASAQDGETVTLTAHPDDGYALDKFYVDGTELPGNTFVIQGGDVTVSATFVEFYGDVLTRADTGATSSSYVTWTATGTTGTKYAGQSAGGNESIQLRAQSPSGIVITNSNGRDVKSVTVEWNDSTVAARTNQIYGKTTPYTGSADLYGNNKGTLLGEIARDETTFAVPAGYPYIGILAKGGAVYLTSVTIAFASAEPSVTLSPSGALEVYVNDPVTITATPHDFSGDVDWTWYVNNAAVAGATTATFALDTSVAGSYAVTAMANYGNDEMAESEALNVTVKAPSTPHAIEIETDDNGTVTASPNPAMEGVTVTLTAVPNEGYRLDYVESDEVTITDMQFVMPNQNVGVYAYFEGKHDVVIDDQIVNGSVEASPATAFSEETVTLTVQPDEGYKLDTLTVLDEDANEIPVTDMSFVMPKGDAYVFATFVELPDLYFQFETSESWGSYDDATPAFVNTGSTAEDIPSVTFNTSRTLRGNGTNDRKVGGYAMRMAPTSAKDAVVANAAAFAQDISKVAFQYAIYGSDSFESFTVQVSADGETWSDLATQPETPTTSLQTYVNENVPEGMKFIRFVTTNSGSSNERFNIDEIQIWLAEVPMQTVTFNWNGAPLDPIGPYQYPIGGEYDGEGFVGDAPLWAGHVFLGWWTDRVNGDRIRQGVEVSDQDSLEVFAHWGDEHVVQFNPNGGVCDKVSRICVQGATYYGLPKPTRIGYAFLGWYDDDDGGTLVQNGVTQVPYTAGRTLVAHWSGRQTVTFDANEGQCDVQSKTCIVGGKYYLPKATRDGYAFLGWFLGDTQFKSGVTVVTEDNEITLVARWQGRQTVIFDANEGQCDVQSKTCIKGGKYYLPKATRDGYAFLGWFDGDTQFKSGVTVVTEDNEITLVAHWKERTAPLAISGFSFASKAARATRDVQNDSVECTLWVGTVAGFDYEIQWTPSLLGEWTVLKHWTAAADGETPVTVVIPSDASTGFIRLIELGVE